MNYKKPSNEKICRYAILKILSESNEHRTFNDLVEYSGFEPRRIVTALKQLFTMREISKKKEEITQYFILEQGLRKLKIYEEKMNLQEYWNAPWEDSEGLQ